MNRFSSIFVAVAFSCTVAFSQSYNFVGDGSDTVGLTNLQFSGSGDFPSNFAANVENVAELGVLESTFDGGAGADAIIITNIDVTAGPGGNGLQLTDVGLTAINGSEFQGGSGGSLFAETNPPPLLNAYGGIGLYVNDGSTVIEDSFIYGGNGGSVSTGTNSTTSLEAYAYGGTSLYVTNGSAVIEDSWVYGGNGGSLFSRNSGDKLNVNGGAALYVKDASVDLIGSWFVGGTGGTINAEAASVANGFGGDGIYIVGDSTIATLDNVTATGGTGGSVTNTGNKPAFAYGGAGMTVNPPSKDLHVFGGYYAGGNGGFASSEGVGLTKAPNAAGGAGFAYIGTPPFSLSKLSISGGEFVGGSGGVANGSVDALADGGIGLFAMFADVEIYGGTFIGGEAGTVNGESASRGAGLKVQRSDLLITNGVFRNFGLLFLSDKNPPPLDGVANITGGTFDDAEFSGDGTSFINISGGSFRDIRFAGTGVNNATNLSNISFNNLYLSGSGTNNIALSGTATSSGIISQSGGTVNVNQWAGHHFQDTRILGGTMNFNTQTFNLESGSSFALLGLGSEVYFNDGLAARSGSEITTTFDGANSPIIQGTDLLFESGMKWIVDGEDNPIASGDVIEMAAASSSLTSYLGLIDVTYIGENSTWMGGFSVLNTNATHLSATYTIQPLELALELDPASEFYKAMGQLSDYIGIAESANSQYKELKTTSQERAYKTLKNEFENSPKMANALIHLQGGVVGQIKDRSRSYLRYKNWGGTTSHSPQGALGPGFWDTSMDRLSESLPGWGARKASAHPPKSGRDKIELPETYQAWGSGYGSYIKKNETDDVGGYDASIGGGVLGLDKRFNNLLLGLGTGYAHTSLKENWEGGSEADTFYGTVYAAVDGEIGFLELNANYAFNDVESKGAPIVGSYEGEYNAGTLGMYIGGGLGFSMFKDSLLFTPEASLLATYYDRESYTESSPATEAEGSFPDRVWDAYDQWSYLGSLGATLSMIKQIESFDLEMEFQPELRAHWLHEFNAEMDDASYVMETFTDPIETVFNAREEDLVKLGTGVRFSQWNSDSLEFRLDLDVLFGQDYKAYIGSAKLLHRF